MDNYKGPGKTLTLAAPYDRLAGQGALVGALFGVAIVDVLSTVEADFLTEGEFSITKLSWLVWAVGQRLYWDNSNKRLDEDSTVGPLVAIATEVTANPSTTGKCVLVGPSEGSEGPQATVADLAGTLTGTVDGTMVDVAASAGACAGVAEPSATQVDTAIATAVATIVTGVNTQNKELLTKVNAILAALRLYPVIKT